MGTSQDTISWACLRSGTHGVGGKGHHFGAVKGMCHPPASLCSPGPSTCTFLPSDKKYVIAQIGDISSDLQGCLLPVLGWAIFTSFTTPPLGLVFSSAGF